MTYTYKFKDWKENEPKTSKIELQTYLSTSDISDITIKRHGSKLSIYWHDKEGLAHFREYWPEIDSDDEKTNDEKRFSAEWKLLHLELDD